MRSYLMRHHSDGGIDMTGTLTVGALFAGYDGIGIALRNLLGAEPVWFSENEDAPSRVLAHHWPAVPNLGDLTAIDWGAVEPVDIITGGFPCQDLSLAGKQGGMAHGTRSGLWSHMATAIETIRPRLVVAENVRGLLSGKAHSNLEQCDGCVDDGPGGHIRALGVVLGDLAAIGYDAQWCGLRASAAGAPHGRFRVFVLAHPATHPGGQAGSLRPGPGQDDATGLGRARPNHGGLPAPDTEGNGRHQRRPESTGRLGQLVSPGDSEPVTDPDQKGLEVRGILLGYAEPQCPAAERGGAATDAVGSGWDGWPPESLGDAPGRAAPAGSGADVATDWGQYEPAIRQWERLTRSAPAPTETGPRGGERLAPRFVEWMMGLPDGHVTDPAIGLIRNEQLKALGNGVVPQQAEMAVRELLQRIGRLK